MLLQCKVIAFRVWKLCFYYMKVMLWEAKKALFSPKNEKEKVVSCYNLLFYCYIFLVNFSRLRIVMKC